MKRKTCQYGKFHGMTAKMIPVGSNHTWLSFAVDSIFNRLQVIFPMFCVIPA